MYFRFTAAAAAIGLMAANSAIYAAPATDASGFIANLGNSAVHVLQTQQSDAARKKSFQTLFGQGFDTPAIAKFVLGRYWRTATPDQQNQYVSVFADYVVTLYADQFSKYSGQEFKVLGAVPGQPGISSVKSQIISPNGTPPINITWEVAKEGDAYKITDVSVENLSMAVTKREEFASVIEQNGGSVQALINQLKQKVQEG